ncbi:uncharacterized protein VP01_534g6 [Puccinia sorghi]|uniref:Uncharacterized protein n=1 Tax=Puccinia sorghi TaxID=27349 RepID=A0A0L6UK22_9BASI|nr:uncharacterized protein VP01_534g6 [Puccinia sorghi]
MIYIVSHPPAPQPCNPKTNTTYLPSCIQPNPKLAIADIVTPIAVLFTSEMWNKFESEPYYGDARRALYPQFLLDARPDLFREIACLWAY